MRIVKYMALALAAAALVAGCDRQPQAWQKASDENTAAAYDAYLEDFPEGAHAADARARRERLVEADAWSKAAKSDTADAYKAYLANHPDGEHAAQARERAAKAGAEQDWTKARSANSATAYGDYARNHPGDEHAAEARLLSKMLGGIEEGRPANIGKVRARILSVEGGEIVVSTLDAVKLGKLTVPPREMTFNAESSAIEGAAEPEVGDVVTLYLRETGGESKQAEPRVIGVLAVPPAPDTE